jgi:hypothetical protein
MPARTIRTLAAAGVAAIVSGGILATAQSASAVEGLVTVQRTSVSSSSAEKVQAVACPPGSRAIGGSAVVGGSTKIKINTEVLDAAGFTVLAREPRGGVSASWYVVVTAQCAPVAALPGLEYRRTDSAYTSASTHAAIAACTPGKKLIGVGGLIDSNGSGQDKLVLTAIRPSPDLTSVVVTASEDEAGYSGKWRATSVAVCADPVGQHLVTGQSAINSTASKQAVAVCPAGTRIHSGGFDLGSGRGQVALRTSYLDYDVPPVTSLQGFDAQAHEDQSGFAGRWRVAAYAICAS